MLAKAQIDNLLASTESVKQRMQVMQDAMKKVQTGAVSVPTRMGNLNQSMEQVITTFSKLQHNPDFVGAPIQELLHAVETTKQSNQKCMQSFLSIIPATQEFDVSISSLILSLEALSLWLKRENVSAIERLHEFKCRYCHSSVRQQDIFCGACGKQLLPTTDTNWPI